MKHNHKSMPTLYVSISSLLLKAVSSSKKVRIRLEISDKYPWVSEIISLDNIKFSQELINNETNQE